MQIHGDRSLIPFAGHVGICRAEKAPATVVPAKPRNFRLIYVFETPRRGKLYVLRIMQ